MLPATKQSRCICNNSILPGLLKSQVGQFHINDLKLFGVERESHRKLQSVMYCCSCLRGHAPNKRPCFAYCEVNNSELFVHALYM